MMTILNFEIFNRLHLSKISGTIVGAGFYSIIISNTNNLLQDTSSSTEYTIWSGYWRQTNILNCANDINLFCWLSLAALTFTNLLGAKNKLKYRDKRVEQAGRSLQRLYVQDTGDRLLFWTNVLTNIIVWLSLADISVS